MRTLKRSECAILHLVLKRKWFDMIASGEKREEYRDDSLYWKIRLRNWRERAIALPTPLHQVVAFSRGYRRADMFFLAFVWPHPRSIVCRREYPRHEWGEPRTPHYVIVLGERINLED